jgi:excisionase family DNA binding protein
MIDDLKSRDYDEGPLIVEETLLTQKQVAEIFKKSRQTITNWRNAGLLPTYRVGIGRAIGFRRSDVDELLSKLDYAWRLEDE